MRLGEPRIALRRVMITLERNVPVFHPRIGLGQAGTMSSPWANRSRLPRARCGLRRAVASGALLPRAHCSLGRVVSGVPCDRRRTMVGSVNEGNKSMIVSIWCKERGRLIASYKKTLLGAMEQHRATHRDKHKYLQHTPRLRSRLGLFKERSKRALC
jgi:hypothetical protein